MKGLQRRAFLKRALLAGAGTTLATGITNAQDEKTMPLEPRKERPNAAPTGKKIIVAGAGISGLCCAYELMKSGHDVVVLEATGRHGGHVFTGRDGFADGLYADYGADHITDPGYER